MSMEAQMRPNLPDPATAPELFDGVLLRRVLAFLVDMVIISFLVAVVSLVGGILGFLTLGLAWLALPFVIIAAIVGYYAVTLGSHARATVGMQMMDIVLTPTRGQPLDGPLAVVHALLFWITVWICWPVSLAFALFTQRQQMVHDLIVGGLMLRRSPMVRHWNDVRRNGQQAA
jgi:uncharacterized RDD family membrane protein YckC